MTNLCRDEVTSVLKDKIEAVFGSSFNTNGLGGVLTCGVTGMKAGLSHSPTSVSRRFSGPWTPTCFLFLQPTRRQPARRCSIGHL